MGGTVHIRHTLRMGAALLGRKEHGENLSMDILRAQRQTELLSEKWWMMQQLTLGGNGVLGLIENRITVKMKKKSLMCTTLRSLASSCEGGVVKSGRRRVLVLTTRRVSTKIHTQVYALWPSLVRRG